MLCKRAHKDNPYHYYYNWYNITSDIHMQSAFITDTAGIDCPDTCMQIRAVEQL